MRKEYLKYLSCPECHEDLVFKDIIKEENDFVITGVLRCIKCLKEFDIIKAIPRFVPRENYASSFGLQWTKHAQTQYDSYSGIKISEQRFFDETGWPRKMEEEVILEVGSGAGRFTEHAASTGAMVISMDYSYAVEANYAFNGKKDNVFVLQADLYQMPFKKNFFDRLFCFGTLQHTPNVEKAFLSLPPFLKPGGKLVVDVYRKPRDLMDFLMQVRHLVRPITIRLSPETLYWWCTAYIKFMFPISRKIGKLKIGRKKIGKILNWMLLVPDYRGKYDFSEDVALDWAICRIFDMLSPRYEYQQTPDIVNEWFRKANLSAVEVKYGGNGIEGHGIKPF